MSLGLAAAFLMQASFPDAPTEVAAASPSWVRSPGPTDYFRHYPQDAAREHLSGRVTLSCRVLTTGLLADCSAVDGQPTGAGFEAAGLALQGAFAVSPTSELVGRAVRIPLIFRRPADVQAGSISVDDARVSGALVGLECRYTKTHLDNCFADGAHPADVRQIALELADSVTLPPMPRPRGRIAFSLRFASADPASDEAVPSLLSRPDWQRLPTANDIGRAYPSAAAKKRLGGRVVTSCQVAKDGRLAGCQVIEEAPAGFGFGEAALKLMSQFRMRPPTRGGAPIEGGTVRVPIQFFVP